MAQIIAALVFILSGVTLFLLLNPRSKSRDQDTALANRLLAGLLEERPGLGRKENR